MEPIVAAAKAFFDSVGIAYQEHREGHLTAVFGFTGRIYRAVVRSQTIDQVAIGSLYIGGLGAVPEAKRSTIAQVVAALNGQGWGKPVPDEDYALGLALDLVGSSHSFGCGAFKVAWDLLLGRVDAVEKLRAAVVMLGMSGDEALRLLQPATDEGRPVSRLEREIEEILQSKPSRTTPDPPSAGSGVKGQRWAVILLRVGCDKTAAIKVVLESTGRGLKDCKDIVERAPTEIMRGLTRRKARALAKQLEAAGLVVEVAAPKEDAE